MAGKKKGFNGGLSGYRDQLDKEPVRKGGLVGISWEQEMNQAGRKIIKKSKGRR